MDERGGPADRRPRRPWSAAAAAALGPPDAVRHPSRWTPSRRCASAPERALHATYAALDLGTNNCRLLVARPTADGFRVVDAFSRIIRLGEGIAASRRISEAAIARAVEALLICRDKMRARGVRRARLIATEACRAAENGEAFRARVAEEAGLELEIIDSATEARLAATGCTELFDPAAAGVILFDIGGGSSELVRLGRRTALAAGRPRRTSSAGCRCPSASSRWPSVTAAPWCRARSTTPWSRGRRLRRPVRGRASLRPRRLPHARHVRHGDDDCRRVSQAQALRPPPRRRLLAVRRRGFARGRASSWP